MSPLWPATWAVYGPAASDRSRAASWLVGVFHPKAPTAEAVADIWAEPAQPSFSSPGMALPAESKSSSWGSGIVPGTLKGAAAIAGPEARIRTGWEPLVPAPPMANPPNMMSPPVPTSALADRLVRWPGLLVLATFTTAGLLVTLPVALVATQV